MLVTLGSLPTVSALLITVLVMGECVTGCPDGFFGSECQYKCHCKEECDEEDEGCFDCENGFFGPDCQYCVLHKFQVKLNDVDNTCVKERRYNITQTTVDVTCDTILPLKVLTIEGPVAPNICTIYVSAGRNIGLKQRAEQSSTAPTGADSLALNAVDGNNNPDLKAGSCSKTLTESREPEWNLTFTTLASVYRIQIYSSNDNYNMESGFSVSTYSSGGSLIEKHISETPRDARTNPYAFIARSSVPVQTVKIKGSLGWPLSMCEVVVYGDFICPDMRHGLACNHRCLCKGHETCNMMTGKCATGCSPGFYGFQCSLKCNATCNNEPCLQVSGRCYRCSAGYKGENCDEDCFAGTYGRSCENKCSENCANECDPIDGFCECTQGYKQPGCTVCPNGTYGSHCSQNCSAHCLKRTCDHVTGKCLACTGLRKGYFCEECPQGKYGVNCTTNCSMFCLDRKCDPNTGYCLKCMSGRIGAHCTECPTNYYGYTCNATCPENCESGLCHVATGLCTACASNYIGPTCSRAVGYTTKLKYFSPLVILCIIPCIVLLLRKRPEGSEHDDSTDVMSTGSITQEDEGEDNMSDDKSF